ncbi:MAG TPA: sugar phosphate isomerase/epimerase family protein [Chloroflexota bacterium]|nr:sugar phosphate isomerase/epimerase family protein [Chloroflexota bacterium]
MDLSRLSACSIPLRKQPAAEALRVIAAAGFKKVDLLGAEPHFPPVPDDTQLGEIESAAQRSRVRVANLGTYYGRPLPGGDEETKQEVHAAIAGMDAAVRLGARSLRIHPGKDRSRETGFALIPFFKQVAQAAEQRDLWLGIETHGGLSSDAPAMVELCQQVGSPRFGVLFDPCNCAANHVDYKAAWSIFKDHVTHVHLKDGKRLPDGTWQRVHLGEGEVDARWLLNELEKHGSDGDIAVEYEINDVEPAETGLRRWYEYCRAL